MSSFPNNAGIHITYFYVKFSSGTDTLSSGRIWQPCCVWDEPGDSGRFYARSWSSCSGAHGPHQLAAKVSSSPARLVRVTPEISGLDQQNKSTPPRQQREAVGQREVPSGVLLNSLRGLIVSRLIHSKLINEYHPSPAFTLIFMFLHFVPGVFSG